MNEEILTAENWKQTVQAAIKELPDDIELSVAIYEVNTQQIEVRVAVEPLDPEKEGDTCINRIVVTYWNRYSEVWEWEDSLPENQDLHPLMVKSKRDFRKRVSSQKDWPMIMIAPACPGEPTTNYFANKVTVQKLKHEIQRVILQEMREGGGISMCDMDASGSFIREDGSLILEWQGRKKRRKR